MTCRDFIEFLWKYLSGELPPDEHREFERHLEICPVCLAYIRSYEETISLASEAFSEPDGMVPPTVPEVLVQAILEARDSRI